MQKSMNFPRPLKQLSNPFSYFLGGTFPDGTVLLTKYVDTPVTNNAGLAVVAEWMLSGGAL